MGEVVALGQGRGRLSTTPEHANKVREYMGLERWVAWCRARGLDVYGAPGEEFAGPRQAVDAEEGE